MAICESFHYAQAVSIERDKKSGSWALSVHWIPDPSETDCLEKIVAKHGLEVVKLNGRTVFRSQQKPVNASL
jgi:hypothetical protein